MNRRVIIPVVLLLLLAIFGYNPLSPHRNTIDVLTRHYTSFETGSQRQANGIYLVKALTRMPGVKAHMVRWWFADYMQTTQHYKRWHPTAHVWMDWENKKPGKIVGASHLVHEYIGDDLQKLRIQFVEPANFLANYQQQNKQFVVCARVGLLEENINMTSMCHVVRDTPWGAEMRSIFWLGHVAKRDGNNQDSSIEGLLGNTALARFILIDSQMSVDLMTHAIEEMGFLADFLPELYSSQTSSTTDISVK